MNISYDYYRVFYYVAKCRNVTQASQLLMSNQPNVTRTIKNLEAALGCALFVRSHHGVTLTPEGEKLFAHAAVAVEHLESAERELALDKSLQSGTVSIGATEVALRCLLLPVLKQFKQRYSGVQIRVLNYSTPQAVAELKDGLVDLAMVTTPVDVPGDCESVVLKSIHEVAVCGKGFAHLCHREITLAEVNENPVICLGRQTKTYEMYCDWFRQHGLMLVPSIEASTADQILPLVRNELGVGFVPHLFLQDESEQAGIYQLQLREKLPMRSICLLRQKSHPLSIAAKELERTILSAE